MLTNQRREELYQYLLEHKSATVSDMAELFKVSGQTIRRDFEVLEKEGIVTRAYGGAALKSRKAAMVANEAKQQLLTEAKLAICRKAAKLISPNDCIFIDHSTTASTLCDVLGNFPLTVVTNSYSAVSRLANKPEIQVISTGGIYQPVSDSFLGRETVRYLQEHCVDKAFISCRTIDIQRGPSDANELVADMHGAVIKSADSVYMLEDHTKIGKGGFITVCPIQELQYLITDQPLEEEAQRILEENKICIMIAGE